MLCIATLTGRCHLYRGGGSTCISLFSLCGFWLVYPCRRTSPQEAENFRTHWDRGPPGVAHMSCWGEGKGALVQSTCTQLYFRCPNLFLICLLRVHLHWRATWRVWPVCWRPTYQTTKTKSCAYCVPCKSSFLIAAVKFLDSVVIFHQIIFLFAAPAFSQRSSPCTRL